MLQVMLAEDLCVSVLFGDHIGIYIHSVEL